MVMHEATKRESAFLAFVFWPSLSVMAATSAALGLMFLGIHLVYGSSVLLAHHALMFVFSYAVVMGIVALRTSEPFWRAMGKINMWILGYASFFFIAKLLSVRFVEHIGAFCVRDLLVILVCGGILSIVICRAKRGRN
jgi:hypothetical protein